MESDLSPDRGKTSPPVPIKTYQWEDVKRAREAGGYPWTHLLKIPLEGVVTAEDIIRETTPRRSMSREYSKSRTHSPVDRELQRILNLDSSPGSSRRYGEEGEDEGVHIPNFSKEISVDSEDDVLNDAVKAYIVKGADAQSCSRLMTPVEIPKNLSPKSILKRRAPQQQQYVVGITQTQEKTKCCHPLVNKIKHLADKTLHKLERTENEKSPTPKRKKNEDFQEIRQLKSSPGAVRRQKFGAIKLGDSDEMSKTMSIETPPSRKKKEHIYEDIEENNHDKEKNLHFAAEVDKKNHNISSSADENKSNSNKETESLTEKKSNASQDPSLVVEDNISLKAEEHVMEKLHKSGDTDKEALVLDEEMDPEEPNVDEIFQNQFDELRENNDSPNITITEVLEDEANPIDHIVIVPIEVSPSSSPREISRKKNEIELARSEWSKPSSDHEYEIIEKPPSNAVYNVPCAADKSGLVKTDDELSSTTSLERKYLQPNLDDEDQMEEKENMGEDTNEDMASVEALQRDIEDRYFVNTPSTVSRTECEVSTSQVDSSALENLPLKRGDRNKNIESFDTKLQQRFKEGTGKIKTQAGKIKTRLKNIKTPQFTMPERPKINLPSRPKFKMPERPKISLPDRPKFDKRKFSLPDRPKFKKINITEKLNFGDRKKFTLPERPKFNIPDLSKFRMPDRPKINFPSLGKKKEYKVDITTESSTDLRNVATVDFEAKTYPRLFSRKKKCKLPKTSSSPTLNREDTPPATFTFTRVKKVTSETTYIPDSPEQPREYGNVESDHDIGEQFETTYDFDNTEFVNEPGSAQFSENRNAASIPDISPSNQEYNTHVINEINNDEFFVRPRGISRENIQVREYLSDEIRQAFKIPKNVLALMGSNSEINDENMYANEPDADPELMLDENYQERYSAEDLNDRDDGYYTFPPIRPSRAKRKKKDPEQTKIQYIDDSVNASMQFSDVDLGLSEDHAMNVMNENFEINESTQFDYPPATDLHSIHEYANDDYNEYLDNMPIQSQTLPMPPKRKKKSLKDCAHSSLTDIKVIQPPTAWEETCEPEDIIVYRTEHEYIIPQADTTVTEQSPVPPRRNRSRSSRGTSLCDDDRTSHGAESLTLDINVLPTDEIHIEREIRDESPGYATVDKGLNSPSKTTRRSKSKTPPVRRRKSNSSDRKYYTVGSTKALPDRPPRKKSSTSLLTLDNFSKSSISGDLTQYVEIDEPHFEETHKDLKSGVILNKMKDRPLPPPPRPPRGPKREKKNRVEDTEQQEWKLESEIIPDNIIQNVKEQCVTEDVVEIEVSTQTDPLPDDVDFELGMDENLDISISSSLRDMIDEDSMCKSHSKTIESPHFSRPTSRSEKSLKFSDPKISELSKSTVGRTSPTVILVERRVSSPTRINEREEMLTEASLTVQHIDIDETQIPDVPPLPKPRGFTYREEKAAKSIPPLKKEQALESVNEIASRDVHLDNLITQRLQVRDLDVGRLNVSELQASKVLVSDIEGMTLQVAELDSKSGHISVSGIEFSQSVIDEIVKKFAEITTSQVHEASDHQRPMSREEQTQTDAVPLEPKANSKLVPEEITTQLPVSSKSDEYSRTSPVPLPRSEEQAPPPTPPPRPTGYDDSAAPPQRPPPPDLTPLLYSYLQDISLPPASFYGTRTLRERPFTEFHESQHQSPPTTTRRAKRKPVAPHNDSSSDDESRPRRSPRRIQPAIRGNEPTVVEAGAQFLRVCHGSISRTIRNIFNYFMSHVSGAEDKKDVQMALVIFLVLIAGLIMFGLSDSRTIHHHHWEFFNPPDNKQ